MKKMNLIMLLMALFIGACNSDNLEPDSNYHNDSNADNPYFVSIEEAISKADDFFSQLAAETRGFNSPRIIDHVEVYTRGNRLTRSLNASPDFYVINYIDEGGFALMSTDSRRTAVYGFSTEGHLSLSDTIYNEALRSYLAESASLPVVTPDIPITGDSISSPVTGTLKILVPPMLNENVRNWDQLSLNKYVCDNPKDSIPVGCVALATAQIMSYFQWPDRWPIENYSKAKEKYEFNWSEMLKTRVNDKTARLLEILGRSEYLNIRYNSVNNGGSSAYPSRIPSTMEKFGYKKPRIKDSLNSDTIISFLYKKSPVLMNGFPQTGGYGHEWTVDGVAQYKEAYVHHLHGPVYRIYYHFIWGNWGGSNGYFYFDDSSKSFEDSARTFDEVDKGHGNINERWERIKIIVDFQVDLNKISK